MIELSESDPQAKEMIKDALDQMPNFSDNLQSNSILNRRIMKLKMEKGFNINKDETVSDAKQGVQTETAVNYALSQIQLDQPKK